MADPFRDELNAALEHVARLESENEDLRARGDASEKNDADEELKRLRGENDSLRRDKRKLAGENDDLRSVHAENETLRKQNEDLLARTRRCSSGWRSSSE